MYYWNKDNFEGLLELAGELKNTPELGLLAEYCVLREKGLRSRAFARLEDFFKAASSWDARTARSVVLIILHASARKPEAHQFLTYPLLTKLIYPTFEQWVAEVPTAVEPLRWLGLLQSDAHALRTALSLDPSDVPVRRRLVDFALGFAYFATHHLSDSILLSTVDETRESIALARQWIASAPDAKPFEDQSADADLYERMLNDWVAYKASPAGTFPEWCQARGRTYFWPRTYYYAASSS